MVAFVGSCVLRGNSGFYGSKVDGLSESGSSSGKISMQVLRRNLKWNSLARKLGRRAELATRKGVPGLTPIEAAADAYMRHRMNGREVDEDIRLRQEGREAEFRARQKPVLQQVAEFFENRKVAACKAGDSDSREKLLASYPRFAAAFVETSAKKELNKRSQSPLRSFLMESLRSVHGMGVAPTRKEIQA